MNGGTHGAYATIFNWVIGLIGTVITGTTMLIGKKVWEHDREIGELKTGQGAMSSDIIEIKTDIRAIRNHLEGGR